MLLNVDAGEFAREPEALYRLAHAVNIACGGHAGERAWMERVLRACKRYGSRAGAHPSYPDRDGFGRVSLALPVAELAASIEAQCRVLSTVANEVGIPIAHIKFHGALYHDANRDAEIMKHCAEAAERGLNSLLIDRAERVSEQPCPAREWPRPIDQQAGNSRVIWVGPPEGEIARWAKMNGRRFEREGFSDRGYRADGTLIPRGQPGAMLERVQDVLEQVSSFEGRYDTICVHGDSPHAVEFASALREYLNRAEGSSRNDSNHEESNRIASSRNDSNANHQKKGEVG